MSTVTGFLAEVHQDVLTGKISLGDALLKARESAPKASDAHILWSEYGNKKVFIRTVTHHYTGMMSHLADGFIRLNDATWIADDGRFNECLKTGTVNECEPFPTHCYVAIGSIVDICEWSHGLPRQVK
jgi:hypothetical protein